MVLTPVAATVLAEQQRVRVVEGDKRRAEEDARAAEAFALARRALLPAGVHASTPAPADPRRTDAPLGHVTSPRSDAIVARNAGWSPSLT